ncbi:lipid-A-disaccharide synthase [Candidatus Margulisiibacteriota bacterium]
MKILIISGEISGDIYGAALAEELLKCKSSVKIYGIGGEKLKAIAHCFLFDIATSHAIGLTERFNKRKFYSRFYKTLEEFLEKNRLDKVVLIDFQHHNFKLAQILRRYSIPIITFITPNFWIWNDLRGVRGVVQYSHKIITIYKKEYELYSRFYPSVYYFGHPILDLYNKQKEERQKPKGNKQVISLFPGSRIQEINSLLPKMLETVKILNEKEKTKYLFYLKVSSSKFMPLIVKHLKEAKASFVRIWDQGQGNIYTYSDLILSSAGSVTLEAVLNDVPLIVMGALSKLTYFVAKYILKISPKFIALPNIVADKEIVPEYIQDSIIPVNMADKAEELLEPDKRDSMLAQYQTVKDELYEVDHPFKRICETILE